VIRIVFDQLANLVREDWLSFAVNELSFLGLVPYEDPVFKGAGPTTASQTAWAVMGLCTFGDAHRSSVVRGIQYLVRNQNSVGTWTELETTGTGFPKVFYLKYDIYRNSWPLMALASFKKLAFPETAQVQSNST